MRPIIDAHLDINRNTLSFDRDQRLDLGQLCPLGFALTGAARSACSVSIHEMRRVNVRARMATLLCHALPARVPQ